MLKKCCQLVRGSSFRNDLLQNQYFNQKVQKFDELQISNSTEYSTVITPNYKTKVRRTSGLCLILWICFNLLGFDDFFNFFLLLHQNVRFRFKMHFRESKNLFFFKSCQKSREIVGRFINFYGKA